MFQTFDELKTFIKQHKIAMFDLKFTDLFGKLHHLTLPVSQVTRDFLKKR